jgi:adenylosuccinate synthase
MKKVTLIVDLQFGSTGKGLIAGYIAERDNPDVVINANMPNAGHTYIDAVGRTFMHKVIPNGIVSHNVKYVLIGPGSVFDYDRLVLEVRQAKQLLPDDHPFQGALILVHPDAMVLDSEHKEFEANNLSRISSTMQGSMAALIDKMMRDPQRDYRAATVLPKIGANCWLTTHSRYAEIIRNADCILAEGAQGYSLGLNAGFWPFCTSRDCTPARFMADMAIPLPYLKTVVGTARVHPIRVGNTSDGYSGDVYMDQKEISFADLGVATELTTVTKRPRRVFTFSQIQIEQAVAACMPDEVFLNFCNYDMDESIQIKHQINDACHAVGAGRVAYLGTGPTQDDITEV